MNFAVSFDDNKFKLEQYYYDISHDKVKKASIDLSEEVDLNKFIYDKKDYKST